MKAALGVFIFAAACSFLAILDDDPTEKQAVQAGQTAKLAVGQDFVSGPAQRRRVVLGEGTTFLLNQATKGRHTAINEIYLIQGEVYVDASKFTIRTGQRQIHVNGKVDVRVDKQGTAVIVVHGEAKAEGVKNPLKANQQLAPGALQASPLPRNCHVLDWTKDLLKTGG